jgi:hypothetical protein
MTEGIAKLFDKHIPKIHHFCLNYEYDVYQNNPKFFKESNFLLPSYFNADKDYERSRIIFLCPSMNN